MVRFELWRPVGSRGVPHASVFSKYSSSCFCSQLSVCSLVYAIVVFKLRFFQNFNPSLASLICVFPVSPLSRTAVMLSSRRTYFNARERETHRQLSWSHNHRRALVRTTLSDHTSFDTMVFDNFPRTADRVREAMKISSKTSTFRPLRIQKNISTTARC